MGTLNGACLLGRLGEKWGLRYANILQIAD